MKLSFQNLIFLILGLVLELLIGTLLRVYVGIVHSAWVLSVFIVLLLLGWHHFKKPAIGYEAGAWLLVGLCLVMLPFRIVYFKDTLITLPDFLFHCLSVPLAWTLIRPKKVAGILLSLCMAALLVFYVVEGQDRWCQYMDHGNFTGRVSNVFTGEIQVTDTAGNVEILNAKNRYTVADFWDTRCGVCFRQMPEWEAWMTALSKREDIVFMSVNIPYENDTETRALEMVRDRGHRFEVFKTSGRDIMQQLGFQGVPQILIFNHSGELVFKGSQKLAKKELKRLIER